MFQLHSVVEGVEIVAGIVTALLLWAFSAAPHNRRMIAVFIAIFFTTTALMAWTGHNVRAYMLSSTKFASFDDMKAAEELGQTDVEFIAEQEYIQARKDFSDQQTAAMLVAQAEERERVAAEEVVQAKAEAERKRVADAQAVITKNIACRQDFECWAGKVYVDYAHYCDQFLDERLAFGMSWDTPFMSMKWRANGWDQADGSIIFVSNGLQVGNAFGAKRKGFATCTVNPTKNTVATDLLS